MTDTLQHDAVAKYDLNDRYRTGAPAVLLTGVQAIARLLVEQHELDRRQGRRTAAFVSGYQGSPLGGVDRLLGGMPGTLAANDVTFVPGLNEELAATAVWGSQMDLPVGASPYDGVVGIWYGKGPGLDRATDTLRHANMFGVNPNGGALLLVGDDPGSKSSTVPAVSERSLAALGIPVLFPRNATEIVTLGLHGIAMSRASGCLVALKIVADVADGAWTVDDTVSQVQTTTPPSKWDGLPWTYRQRTVDLAPGRIQAAEDDLYGPRTAAVIAYAAANNLNPVEVDPPAPTVGLIASGSTYNALRQSLLDLGVDDAQLERSGIRVMRMGMIHPVDQAAIVEFAAGLEEILVVEDKTAFLETHIRDALYGTAHTPRVLGKKDAAGQPLVPHDGELTAGRLTGPLRRVLRDRVPLAAPASGPIQLPVLSTSRAPYFCSGCPHNRSTVLPEGSIGGGGIGCHTMVTLEARQASSVVAITQMGGEGAQWIGQAPFTDVGHIFQNVGDGTYFHSGQLAVQACVAAGVNITYKLLYNEVVAMTGAQDAEGALPVEALTHKLTHEGVSKIIICADEPDRHRRRKLAKGTLLWHRDRLDEAQRLLRDTPGVTVLIYDQHCAADARRQRKRGTLPARTTRVVINEAVCEGCGDCGRKSNCLSVRPVDTEYGRKTRIDQTSCNTDYSCLDGDCPSFVTVEVDPEARQARHTIPDPPKVPAPPSPGRSGPQDVFLAGIGGTGIVTVNQVLATAAILAGYEVETLDQIGLSQKAGPVTGHLRFAEVKLEPSNRVSPGASDCILAFDLLTAAEPRNLAYGDPSTTIAVASTSETPTGDMVYDPAVSYVAAEELVTRLESVTAELHSFDALAAAEKLFGNNAAANFLIVGAAYQSGALQIPAGAIEEAIGINGVAVSANVAAFRWGRAAVAAPDRFAAATAPPERAKAPVPPAALAGSPLDGEVRRLVELRSAELVGYQDVKTAENYIRFVERVWDAERAVTPQTRFTEAVARYLYKLTAYKDEYEVARLLTAPGFVEAATAEVPGSGRVTFQLHPPILRALGRKKKVRFGPPSHRVLRSLAALKGLRGTRLDLFGYAHVRRLERALVAHYREVVTSLAESLTPENYERAVRVASLPDLVRGYEGVKLANVAHYRESLAAEGIDTPWSQAAPLTAGQEQG
ncbi:indolepyruvate ferredoxin oxidoreductase family protein [Amycolatopsis pithecellobii]|uniref:Indolepyruvate ferredoxin oxidoreductase family protein n=1 Tax=Amycolatopsis pithecellobii TaxID=664692 RepID=A0A6N7Z552_9PSEU|nr:indolepyruvate ferredoxin oxidoreductase family protein [Amycolatopsis pithecellobii]MTD55580.1 indolepyruvate ferredoxin oxidoreductase family protein [Amycolatopsis pithecellobii]